MNIRMTSGQLLISGEKKKKKNRRKRKEMENGGFVFVALQLPSD